MQLTELEVELCDGFSMKRTKRSHHVPQALPEKRRKTPVNRYNNILFNQSEELFLGFTGMQYYFCEVFLNLFFDFKGKRNK